MGSGIRHYAAAAVRQVPTLLVLALLGGIAVWGWYNDWKLPALSGTLEKRAKDKSGEEPSENGSTPTGPKRIELASAEAVRKADFKFAEVETRPMAQYVVALGMIDYDPSRYARLTVRAPGSVWRVVKEIGDPIHAGEALAFIDAVDVGRARASFLQSLTQYRLSKATFDRLKGLESQGASSERAVLDADFALRQARLRMFHDQQVLLNYGLPVRWQDVEKVPEDQLIRQVRLIGLPPSVLGQVDADTLTANLLPLTAPFDGMVVQRNVAPGEIVMPTEPKALFVVADLHHLHVDLDVNPGDMAEVRPGLKVLFQPDGARAAPATAKISHISPEVDEKTRRVRVHAELENPDLKLRPNTFGTGRILIREQPKTLAVPAAALQSDGTTPLVFVRISDKAFEARPVQPGLRADGYVEVAGVQAGEKVVTIGSFTLKSELLKERIAGDE